MATFLATCAHCGAIFEAQRTTAQFHSTACRVAALRESREHERLALLRERDEFRSTLGGILARLADALDAGDEPALLAIAAEAAAFAPTTVHA